MFEFKHPKYYTELRKRNKEEARAQLKVPSSDLDQVISKEPATAGNQRAPGPGLSNKQQASHKLVTPRSDQKEASSNKQQALSSKRR